MSVNLRAKVLKTFKTLHRTRLNTFKDDDYALRVVRQTINDEFRKNMNVSNKEAEELNKTARAIEEEIRTKLVQAVEKAPGKFEVRLRADNLVDNAAIPNPSAFSCNLSTKKCNVPPKKDP